MKIGIVIAIVRELKAFLDSDYKVEICKINNREVYKTNINNNEVYIIKSGYGKIDAASATQLLISNFNVDIILNYGVTGAVEKGLSVDDLFVVTDTVNSDYDVSPIDPVKKHQYEEFKDIYLQLDKEFISLVKSIAPNIKEAKDASGDKFIEKLEDKQYLNSLGCNICDMELAGIVRTCWLNNVRCCSIKAISDTLEGSGTDFNENVVKSANKAFEIIKQLLEKI